MTYLTNLVAGSRLKPLRTLAKEAGCSVNTLRKRLQPFFDREILQSRPGGALYYRKDCQTIRSVPRQTTQERITELISTAIADGHFIRGSKLPSIKQLSANYKVSTITVSKALHHLERNGLICKIGKTFRIGGQEESLYKQPRQEVALFFSDINELKTGTGPHFWKCLLEELSQVLVQNNLFLRFYTTRQLHDQLRIWLNQPAIPYGIIIADCDSKSLKLVDDFCKNPLTIRYKRFPSAITVHYDIPDIRITNKQIGMFVMGNQPTIRARALAKFCCNKNYTTIFCFYNPNESVLNNFRDLFRFIAELYHRNHSISVKLLFEVTSDIADSAS